MMGDSPVQFPESGALPAEYPPDQPATHEPVEDEYFLFSSPERSLQQIRAIRTEMPRGGYTAPSNDWRHLERARDLLAGGGSFHLLGLGDSIVNDTMRSGWIALLQEVYPAAEVRATVYVRGGGGCHHYIDEGRIERFVVPRRPDVVFIGGISQNGIDPIREAIRQIRAGLPDVEFLLATGAFGNVDPRDRDALAEAPHSGTGSYGPALRELAESEQCAFVDMTTPWAEYIRSSGLHPHLFYRDRVHANEFGEQILAKVMMTFWEPL